MKARIFGLAVMMAIAAAGLAYWYAQPSKRDADVARCMDGGDGDMFTSREGCEERYPENGATR